MPRFLGLTIYTDLQCAGGSPVVDIPDVVSGRLVEGVDNGTEDSLAFGVPKSSPALASLVAASKRVIRVWFNDGSFSEWPLAKDASPYVGGDGIVQITCEPAVIRLAQIGLMAQLGTGGLRTFDEAYAGLTPTQYIDAVITRLTALGASWVARGTIDPTMLLDLTWSYATPLAVVLQVRDGVKAKGATCEFDFRRNGTSGYYIDLLTQIASSATVPEFRAQKSITELQYARNRTRQATVAQPKGAVDATGYPGTMARARWTVSSVNGGAKRLTLADPAGGAGPIAFDDQLNGKYLYRERTGRSFLIVDTLKATQEIELSDVSPFAAHTVTAPEYVSFRDTEPSTGTRSIGSTSTAGSTVLEVTGVAGAVLSCREYSVGTDVLDIDDRFVDWRAERASFVLATSVSWSVTDRLDCASVTGVAVGDIAIVGSNAAHPYSIGTPIGTVSSIDTVNKYLYVTRRYGSGNVVTGTGVGGQLRTYRPVVTTHLITDSAAAANTVTVDAAGTAAINDILLRIYQPCIGTGLCELSDTANVTAYDRRFRVVERPETGAVNVVPNAFMRTWTGGAAVAPDAWTWTGTGAATIARESTIVEHGPYSALCVFASSTTVGALRTPPAFFNPTADETTVSVRARLYLTSFDSGREWDPTFTYTHPVRSTLTMTVYKETPAGTRTSLGSVILGCPGFANAVALNTWLDVAVEGVDASSLEDDRLVVGFDTSWGGTVAGSLIKGYVDAVQITPTQSAPRALPDLLLEHGEAMILHQATNLELLNWSTPAKEIGISAIDLERLDGSTFSIDAITKGGSIRIIAPDDAIDETLRVLRLDRSITDQADTQLTVATRQLLLTDLLA